MSVAISHDEVQSARAFLRKRGIATQDIPPRSFAKAAKEQRVSFSTLLKFIARTMSGGTQTQKSADNRERIAKEATK